MTSYKSGYIQGYRMSWETGLSFLVNKDNFTIPIKDLPTSLVFSLNFAYSHNKEIVYTTDSGGKLMKIFVQEYPEAD